MTKALFDIAELICGAWVLVSEKPMPTYCGIMDQVIFDLKQHCLLPNHLSEQLSFGCTSVGFRCYELDEIYQIICEGCSGYFISPAFNKLQIVISKDCARRWIKQIVPLNVGFEIGNTMLELANKYEKDVQSAL